jgi:antitoxin (DNA-binding transcriptional repressor) of toxin-antitoxin stability system
LTLKFSRTNVPEMRAIALKALQASLSEYVHLAQEGETVLVTESDRVIARLVPPLAEPRAETARVGLNEAIQKGWITLPANREHPGPPPRIPTACWHELSQELEEDRSER